MTSGPATRLLDAFCALAEAWLAQEPRPVDCGPHGGRFNAEELARFSLGAPAIRAACLGIASAKADTGDAALLEFRLAAVAISDDVPGEDRAAMARRLADRIAFELAREQKDPDGRRLWPQATFSAAELAKGHPGGARWGDVSDPLDIRAANLHSGPLDGKGFAIWAVTWLQQFRAAPPDFDLPLPKPAGIPETVKSGYAPDIGGEHRDKYETVVPEGGA